MSGEQVPAVTIGRIDVVKTLSGGRGAKSGFPEDRYKQIIGNVEDFVFTATQKHDWAPTDVDYDTIRGIVELWAAAQIKWMVDRNDSQATAFNKKAREDLELILSKSSVAGQPASNGINISMPHQSFPANPIAGTHFTGLKKRYPGTNLIINSELSTFFPNRF